MYLPGVNTPRISMFVWAVSLALATALGLIGCDNGEGDSRGARQQGPPTVEVATPEVRTVTRYFEYTGTVRALRTAEIRARVPGFLEEILFEDSAEVEKGDLLFVIEQEPYRVAEQRAEAAVQRALALENEARSRLNRLNAAAEAGATNPFELIEAEATLEQRKADVVEARASLRQAQLELDYTTIESPFSGRVNRNLVDEGNLVGDGENTLLATVVKVQPIYVFFDVSERIALEYMARGRRGNVPAEAQDRVEVGLANETGYPHIGKINYVDNVLDSSTGTIEVRAIFPNENTALYPGLFARIRVPFEEIEDAVVISRNALGVGLEGSYVYVVDNENKVERRPVELGEEQDDGTVVVTSGLGAEDRYVIAGLQRVRAGQEVALASEQQQDQPNAGGGGGVGDQSEGGEG